MRPPPDANGLSLISHSSGRDRPWQYETVQLRVVGPGARDVSSEGHQLPADPSPTCHTFTVFTSTRNRAHTLDRPFRSLQAQTFRDFEWLIIDNGSTDGTPELVARYQAEADFPIRYLWQEDAGKHGSVNRAAPIAEGAFFLILDSDDGCVPVALERFKYHWDQIPADRRARFTGVTAHCLDESGEVVG